MRLTRLRPLPFAAAVVVLEAAGGSPTAARPDGPRRLDVDTADHFHVEAVRFSPDGAVVAVGGATIVGVGGEDVRTLFDAATGRRLHTFRRDGATDRDFTFCPDGKILASPAGAGA